MVISTLYFFLLENLSLGHGQKGGEKGQRNRKKKKNAKPLHGKSPRADGHRTGHRGRNPSPEPSPPFPSPRLAHAIRHPGVLHAGAEAVALHLALDDVEGVAGEPEALARESAVERHPPLTDIFARFRFSNPAVVVVAAGHVGVHHPLEGAEPGAVRGRFAQHRHQLAAVEVPRRARARLPGDVPDAVERAGVEPLRAVRLRLQSDPNVLDRTRKDGVGDARECSRGVVLRVGERAAGRVGGGELPPRPVKGAELDGYLWRGIRVKERVVGA